MVRPGENPEGRGRLPFWSFASRRSSEVRIAGRRVGAQSQASLLLEQRRWVGQDVPESSDFVIDDLGVWVSDPAEPVAAFSSRTREKCAASRKTAKIARSDAKTR